MLVDINTLFGMLDINNDISVQQKGIEEGKKVKYLSVFMQPIESKNVWENCAKIIVSKSDEELDKYVFFLMEWLQDENWPGFDIILNRLKTMPESMIVGDYGYFIKKAVKVDIDWLERLSYLSENKKLYQMLPDDCKAILDQYKIE